MSTWTLYTFGDGDIIAAVLQAVALLVDGGMGSLLRAVAIGGLGITLSMAAVGALAWTRAVSWLVGFLVVFTGLIQMTVPLAVEDVADPRIPAQVVQNVPLLVALPAALSSQIAYQTTLLATSLQLNGELGNGQTFLAPSINVQTLLSANLQPGDLRANIINYVNYCVAPPNSHLVYPPGVIPHSPDLFAKLESTEEATTVPTVVNGEIVGSLSCREHYQSVLTPALAPLTPAADLGLMKTIEDLKCQIAGGRRIVGGPASCADDAAFWTILNDSLQALHLSAWSADQVLVTAMLAKLLLEGEMDYAKRIMDEPAAIQIANDGLIKQLEIQSKAGADSVKSGLVRQIRALADGTVLLGAPVLLALSATPLVWTFLGIYVRLFAWLALWGPIQAVTHFVALTMAASDLGGLAGTSGITAANLHDTFLHLVQTNALGYDMLLAVPAIALAMAWGGVGALGGALQGAAQGLLRTSQDTWRRVESGEAVLASSLAKVQVLEEGLRRPPNDAAFTTAQMQDAWARGVASRSLQGSTIQTPDGRTITTMRDGSSRIQSPTQDMSITPQGHKTGWQLLDQEQTVKTPEGTYTLPKGSYVRWTGHGAEVNLPSEKDPMTGQTVAPIGRFAQDPNKPGGFGALQSKEWTVTREGLTYHATQGKDGAILYEVAGRTDLQVLNRDGTLTHATGDVRGMAVLKPGDTPSSIQATITALTQNGERLNAVGTLTPPTQALTGNDWLARLGKNPDRTNPSVQYWERHPDELISNVKLFVPYAGEASNVMEENRVAQVSVNGQPATLKAEHQTGTDGQGWTSVEVKTQWGTYRTTIPDRVGPEGQVPVQLEGVVPNVKLFGAGLPHDATVDLPVNARGTLTLPSDLKDNWTSDPSSLVKAIEQWTITLAPFTALVPDPNDPTRTLKLTVNKLFPPDPEKTYPGTLTSAPTQPPPGVDAVVPTVPVTPWDKWVAEVSSFESKTTAWIKLEAGATQMPGTFRVFGETEIKGDVLHGRNVVIRYTAPNGQVMQFGAGEVQARRGKEPGSWEIVSLKAANGMDIAQNGKLMIDRTEQVRGVSARVQAVIDPSTGQAVDRQVTIGVTQANLDQVRNAFKSGPVALKPGGRITIQNDGQVSYDGPAEILVRGQADGQPFEATVQGMAKFQGRYDSRTGAMTFQAGQLSDRNEIIASSSQFPGSIAEFFRNVAGQSGVVRLTVNAKGDAMTIDGESGDTLRVGKNVRDIKQDVQNIEKNTLKMDSQTAFNAALWGDRRVLGEPIFLERDNDKQYTRAAAVALALSQELAKRIEWTGTSEGATKLSGGGAINLQEVLAKLPEGLRKKLSPKAGVEWSYGLTEQQVTNLFYNHLMDLYQQAREESGGDSGRAIARYTTDVGDFVREMEEKVRKNTPSTYGTNAVLGILAQAPEEAGRFMRQAAQAASGLMQDAANRANELLNQPGSNTPPPSGAGDGSGNQHGQSGTNGSPNLQSGLRSGTPVEPSPAEWRRILDSNPPVKQMLATAMDQFRKGDISESQFRELARSAFREVYVGQPGSKSGKNLDQAMRSAHRAADEFVEYVVNAATTQHGSSSAADQSAQKRAPGREIGSAAPAPNRPANQASQSPASPGSKSDSTQGSGLGAAQASVPPTGKPTPSSAPTPKRPADLRSNTDATPPSGPSAPEQSVESLQAQTLKAIGQAEQAIEQLNKMEAEKAAAASPRPSPLQTQPAPPGDTDSSRTQKTPSAAAEQPAASGAAAAPSVEAESQERRSAQPHSKGYERASRVDRQPPQAEHPPIIEDQSGENFVRVRQVMEDLAAKRIEVRDVPSRVYELYRAQGIDLRGKVLVMGNWRFDFSDYRRRE